MQGSDVAETDDDLQSKTGGVRTTKAKAKDLLNNSSKAANKPKAEKKSKLNVTATVQGYGVAKKDGDPQSKMGVQTTKVMQMTVSSI